MPSWIDDDPTSPLVMYDHGNGQLTPYRRDQAEKFGFTPFAPPPETPIAPTPPPPKPPAPSLPIGQTYAPSPVTPMTPQARLAQEEAQAKARALAAEGDVKAVQADAKAARKASPAPAPAPTATGARPPIDPRGIAAQTAAQMAAAAPPALAEATPPDVTGAEIDAISGGQLAPEPGDPGAELAPPQDRTVTFDGPQSMYEIDQQHADAQRRAVEESSAAAEAEQARQLAERAAETERLERAWLDHQQAIQAASDHKIEPDRKWKSLSTGRKVGSILMALISGFGSVLKRQGDRNPALDLMMAEWDKDVSLQMAEGDQLGRTVDRTRLALDELRDVFGSRDAERLARLSAIATRESNVLREAAAKASSERVKYDYLQLARDMEAAGLKADEDAWYREQDFLMKAGETEAEIRLKHAQAHLAERKAMGGTGAGGGKKLAGTYASMDDIDPKLQKQVVLLPDGSYVIAKSQQAATEADAAIVAARSMVTNIDRALSKVSSMPGFAEKLANKAGWTTEDAAVISQELTGLLLKGKDFYKLGVLSEGDIDLMRKLGADPDGVNALIEQYWPKLQNWRVGIMEDSHSRIRQYIGREFDVQGAFGEAPARPTPKSAPELREQIVAAPTFDGDEIVAAPSYEDARANLKALKEAYIAEGRSDIEWANEMSSVAGDMRANNYQLKKKYDATTEQIEKLEKADKKKHADKIAALKTRRKKYAETMSEYSHIEEDAKQLERESLQKHRNKKDRKDLKEKMLTPVPQPTRQEKRDATRDQVKKDRAQGGTGGSR